MFEPFQTSCSACGAGFRVNKESLVGKRVRCPKCQQPTLIEAPVDAGEVDSDNLDSDNLDSGGLDSGGHVSGGQGAADSFGFGDLSSFGDATSNSTPFPSPGPSSTAYPQSAQPSPPVPRTWFPETPGPRPGVSAPASPTAHYPGGPVGRGQLAPEADENWWSRLSPRAKMRWYMAALSTAMAVAASFVALIGKTPGLGYVGNYSSREAKSLAEMRAEFKTDLRGAGPAPAPVETLRNHLPGSWEYPSVEDRLLQGSLLFPEGDGPFPAVVFCHGGFSVDRRDVENTESFRKAGFAVYVPTWRGENGNEGYFELCYGEVADCVAAMEYLALRDDIDPENIFLVGHSLGAINAVLAAELSTRPRGALAIGGSLDIYGLHKWQPQKFIEEIPYDTSDSREDLLRSPARFIADLSCPLRVVYGSKDFAPMMEQAKALAEQAGKLGKQVEYLEINGADHFNSFVPAMNGGVEFFRQLMRRPRQSPVPVHADRTPEWVARQVTSIQSGTVSDRQPVTMKLDGWNVQPDPAPVQDFTALYELAEQCWIGAPIIAGPRQWWSVSTTELEFSVNDLANRRTHKITGRRSMADDRPWGGPSGFHELGPDGKTMTWRVEVLVAKNKLPKQQIVVRQTHDLGVLRTIEDAVRGQYVSADLLLVAREKYSGKPELRGDARSANRLGYELRLVNLKTGEESAPMPVRTGGIWSISPGKKWLVISHPTAGAATEIDASKEPFLGRPRGMELTVVDLAAWKVAARGDYIGPPSGRALAWSDDGKLLAAVGAGGSVGLWDFATGQATNLTALGDGPRKGESSVRFLGDEPWLLVDGVHLLRLSDGRKVGEFQGAAGVEVDKLQWVGARYRGRNSGAFTAFPWDRLREELRQADDPANNLMFGGQIELSIEAQSGEQLAPVALEFVRTHLPAMIERRFGVKVVQPDGKPRVMAKVRYGETLEVTRKTVQEKTAQAAAGGAPKPHDYGPINTGGAHRCRMTLELTTPDGRVVHSDSVTGEAKLRYGDLWMSTEAQLRTVGTIQALLKLNNQLPIVVPRVEGLAQLPRTFTLNVTPPASAAPMFAETTAAIYSSTGGAVAAAKTPDAVDLPSRRTILVEDRSRLQSSRYLLGIPQVDGRPTLVIHGVRGDTRWIPLNPDGGQEFSASLGQVLPTFSPADPWLASRAKARLELRSIGAGAALSEPKVFTFPADIQALAWSRSGRLLAAAVAPGRIEVYEAEKLRAATALADATPIHKLATNGVALDLHFSADEQRLVALENQQSVVVLDLKSGVPAGRFAPPAAPPTRGNATGFVGCGVTADGRRAYGLMTDALVGFDVATGKEVGQWQMPYATTLVPSPDGRWLAILQSTLRAQLRRADAPDDWRSLSLETKNAVVTTTTALQAAWSGDGRIFAATDQRGTTTIWDVAP